MDYTLTTAASGLPAGKELGNQQMETAFGVGRVAIPVQNVLYGKRDVINEENVSEMTSWIESWVIKVQKETSCRITEREEWEAYLKARDESDDMDIPTPSIGDHDMDLYQYTLDDLLDLQDKLRDLESAVEDLGSCTSRKRGRILSEAEELKDRLDRTSWRYEFKELTEEDLDKMELDCLKRGDYPEYIKEEMDAVFSKDEPTDEELERMYGDYLATLADDEHHYMEARA